MLSGHYDFFHISMGVLSSVAVTLLHYKLRRYYYYEEEMKETSARMKNVSLVKMNYFRLFRYIPWLVWQIVVASLQVAAVVLSPKMPIKPALMKFKTKLPNTSAKVILGNSITLTPGTITIDIDGDEFLVHALMDKSYTGIADDSLPEAVAKLYEKKPEHIVQDVKIIRSDAELS